MDNNILSLSEEKKIKSNRRMMFLIAVDVLVIFILLFVKYENLSKVEKIVTVIWGALPVVLNFFRVEMGKQKSLSEFLGTDWVRDIIKFYTAVIVIFFIIFVAPVQKVDVIAQVEGGSPDSVYVTWQDSKRCTTDSVGSAYVGLFPAGAYEVKYNKKGYREKACTANVGIFSFPPLPSQKRILNYSKDDRIVGKLYVQSEPPEATIWIDGVNKKVRTPSVFDLEADKLHLITLKLDGYRDSDVWKEVKENEENVVSVKLSVLTGLIDVHDTSGADIYLNGRKTGKTTPAKIGCRVGKYELELRKIKGTDFGHSWRTTVLVESRKPKVINKQLGDEDARRLYPLYINSNPQAVIYLNDENLGRTNSEPVYMFEGNYEIKLCEAGYYDKILPVSIPRTYYIDTIRLDQAR